MQIDIYLYYVINYSMDVINLTKELIKIPSYVDSETNELKLADFIFELLKKIPDLTVEKQPLNDKAGRYNIVASTDGPCKLLLGGHMDTVQPRPGWNSEPLQAIEKDDKLFGLGACDMKGGLACILSAITQLSSLPNGLCLLFYCDEEYAFAGMKSFTKQSEIDFSECKLAIIAEPSDLQIWNTHRGVIEVDFSLIGKSGHAANPDSGINAIKTAGIIFNDIETWLNTQTNEQLGNSTLNIARINGGLKTGEENSNAIFSEAGNNIADFADIKLEVRTTSPEINAQSFLEKIKSLSNNYGCTIVNQQIINDYGCLITEKETLDVFENILTTNQFPVKYLDARKRGYGDGQMIKQKFNIPTIYFGPTGENMHAPDENVTTESLKKVASVFENSIKTYCS